MQKIFLLYLIFVFAGMSCKQPDNKKLYSGNAIFRINDYVVSKSEFENDLSILRTQNDKGLDSQQMSQIIFDTYTGLYALGLEAKNIGYEKNSIFQDQFKSISDQIYSHQKLLQEIDLTAHCNFSDKQLKNWYSLVDNFYTINYMRFNIADEKIVNEIVQHAEKGNKLYTIYLYSNELGIAIRNKKIKVMTNNIFAFDYSVAKMIANMDKDETKLIKTNSEYIIVQLQDKQLKKKKSFEEEKNEIKEQIKESRKWSLIDKFIPQENIIINHELLSALHFGEIHNHEIIAVCEKDTIYKEKLNSIVTQADEDTKHHVSKKETRINALSFLLTSKKGDIFNPENNYYEQFPGLINLQKLMEHSIPDPYLFKMVAKSKKWELTLKKYIEYLNTLSPDSRIELYTTKAFPRFFKYIREKDQSNDKTDIVINTAILNSIDHIRGVKNNSFEYSADDCIVKSDSIIFTISDLQKQYNLLSQNKKRYFDIFPNERFFLVSSMITKYFFRTIKDLDLNDSLFLNNLIIQNKYNILAGMFANSNNLNKSKEKFTQKIEELRKKYHNEIHIEIDSTILQELGININHLGKTRNNLHFGLFNTKSTLWKNLDIGEPMIMGNSYWIKNKLLIEGSGHNIQNQSDAFYFYYSEHDGNGGIIAKIDYLEHTHPFAKVGIMIRKDLDPGSENLFCGLAPESTLLHMREGHYLNTHDGLRRNPFIKAPYYVKIIRQGDVFSFFESLNGYEWKELEDKELKLPQKLYFGIAISSHKNNLLCRAHVSNISLVSQFDN